MEAPGIEKSAKNDGAKHSSSCAETAQFSGKSKDRGVRNSLDQIQGFSLRKETYAALFSSGFVQIGWLDPAESWFEVENLKNGEKWTRKKSRRKLASWGVLSTPGARARADPFNYLYASFGF